MDDEKMVYPASRELFRNLLNQLLGGRSASRSDSNYTFRPYDGVVLFTSASAITATIPADTYALNYVLTGVQFGNGVVTFAAGAGVTFVSKDDPVVTAGQYTLVMAKQVSENVWLLFSINAGGGGGGAVSSIIAGDGISVDQATGDVTVSATGGGALLSANISISSAEILALFDTPIELVAAPGANKVIFPVSISLSYTFATIAYTDSTSANIGWGSTSTDAVFGSFDLSVASSWLKSVGGSFECDASLGIDQPVSFWVQDANPQNGDGTLLIDILYRVVDLS